MYAATGGPNVKWGGTDFKWEGRAPLPPPLATALFPTDVESVSSSKNHHDSYTVRSYTSRSSTASKKYGDSVVKVRLAAEELNGERELARQKI